MFSKDLDEYILHLTELAMYSNELVEQVLKATFKRLEDLEKLVEQSGNIHTKKRYQELLNSLDEGSPLFQEEVSDILNTGTKAVIALQLPWLAKMLSSVYKGKIKEPSKLMEKINLATYDGKTSIGDYPSVLSSRVLSPAQGAAKSQYLFSTPSDIASSYVKDSSPALERGIKADVPTIIDAVTRTTETLTYDNIQSIQKVTVSGTLDGRTCLVCASLHGKTFEKHSAPLFPIHHRCRCFLIPYQEGFVPPSYSEWLSRQSEETQKQILGKTRFELYKGGMTVDRFVSNNRKLRLDEIT